MKITVGKGLVIGSVSENGSVSPVPPTPPGYSPEYQAVYDAYTNKPTDAIADADNTMVEALVVGGYWARMEFLNIPACYNNNAGEALFNWINVALYYGTNVDGSAWTSLEGYNGDGSADNINTEWNASINAIHATLNSMAVGIYIRNDVHEGKYDFGDSNTRAILSHNADNRCYGRINAGGNSFILVPDTRGFFILSRTAANLTTLYRNGISLGTTAQVSTSISNNKMTYLGTPTAFSFGTKQVSIFFVMDGVVDATEALAIRTIFQDRMVAVGKGV